MGHHRGKHAHTRPYVPVTAAATLTSLAAAFCILASSPAGAATIPAQHPVTATWADPANIHAAHLASAARPTPALPATYTVRAGDTLTSIAQRLYSDPGAWPVLYWANRIRWADDIDTGQILQVPAEPVRIPAPPTELAPPPPPPVPVAAPVQAAAIPVHPAAPVQAPVQYPAPAPVQAAAAYTGTGTYQACVIRRESGGDPRAVNPSGAGGLYQFMPSTFAGLGYSGRPQDAPVWEQNQAFQRLYAQAGRAPWASDGC